MKKFKVLASYTNYCYTEIEADSLEQAQEIANDMDGGDFTMDGGDGWQIDEVFEIKD